MSSKVPDCPDLSPKNGAKVMFRKVLEAIRFDQTYLQSDSATQVILKILMTII